MTESSEIREFLEKVDGTVEQVVSHIEVLNKMKHLLTIPGTDTMTTRQVADYYGVEIDTVRRVYQRYKAEIDSDGTTVKKAADFLTEHEFQVEDADRLTGQDVTLGTGNVRTEQTVQVKNSDSNIWAGQSVQSKGSRDVRTGQSVHVKNRTENVWTEQSVQSKVEDMLTEPKVQLGGSAVVSSQVQVRTTADFCKLVIWPKLGAELKVSNRGIRVFSQRAVLRIGMLMPGSRVATEVRTQLLNVFEKAPTSTVVESVDNELELRKRVGDSIIAGRFVEAADYISQLPEYLARNNKDNGTV